MPFYLTVCSFTSCTKFKYTVNSFGANELRAIPSNSTFFQNLPKRSICSKYTFIYNELLSFFFCFFGTGCSPPQEKGSLKLILPIALATPARGSLLWAMIYSPCDDRVNKGVIIYFTLLHYKQVFIGYLVHWYCGMHSHFFLNSGQWS